jgi:hypothetical protein
LLPALQDIGYSATFFSDPVKQPVPELTTILLPGSGLIGLGGFARKKFFKKQINI